MGDQLMVLPDHVLKSAANRPKRRGHAGVPGNGPKGETCGSCASIHRLRLAKTYLKCLLMQSNWTGGGGTDIRAKDEACEQWTRQNAVR